MTVGTLVARLSARKSESNNTSQNRLPILLLHTSVKAFPALVRTPVPNNFTNPPSVNIFLTNAQCALHYNKDKFSVLARARTRFHLSALEATFIKSLNPLLCKQKEFIYSLKISYNLLKFPLVDCSNVPTRSKLHFQPMTTRLFLSPKPFLIGHCFNQSLFFCI